MFPSVTEKALTYVTWLFSHQPLFIIFIFYFYLFFFIYFYLFLSESYLKTEQKALNYCGSMQVDLYEIELLLSDFSFNVCIPI